jgi:hypothetical protein
VAVDYMKREVKILLVYGKTDLRGHNETAEWQKIIKENYPEYKKSAVTRTILATAAVNF